MEKNQRCILWHCKLSIYARMRMIGNLFLSLKIGIKYNTFQYTALISWSNLKYEFESGEHACLHQINNCGCNVDQR